MTDTTALQPHRGGLILALGIISLTVFQLLGPVAWIMGNGDLRAMDEGRMDPAGRDLTQAGKICGMIATLLLLFAFLIVFAFLFFGLIVGLASSSS